MKIPYGSSQPSEKQIDFFKSFGFDGTIDKINGCYYLNFLQSKQFRGEIEWFHDDKHRRSLKYIVTHAQTIKDNTPWHSVRTVKHPLIVVEQTTRDKKSCCSFFDTSSFNIELSMDFEKITEVLKEDQIPFRIWPSKSIDGRIDEVLDQLYDVCNGILIPDGGSCRIHWGNVIQQYVPQLGLEIEDLRNHHYDALVGFKVPYDDKRSHNSAWKKHHLEGIIRGRFCANKDFNYAFLDDPEPSPENSPRARKVQ